MSFETFFHTKILTKRLLYWNEKRYLDTFTRSTRATGFDKTGERVWQQTKVKRAQIHIRGWNTKPSTPKKDRVESVVSLTSRSSIQKVITAVTPETSRVQSQVTLAPEDQPQSAKFSNTPPTTLQPYNPTATRPTRHRFIACSRTTAPYVSAFVGPATLCQLFARRPYTLRGWPFITLLTVRGDFS